MRHHRRRKRPRSSSTKAAVATIASDVALHLAAMRGDEPGIVDIINAAAGEKERERPDVLLETEDKYSHTALQLAILSDHVSAARLLLSLGASLEARCELGFTPLHNAVVTGNTELTKLLLVQGASVHVANTYSWTPLHDAACRGDAEIVRILAAHGADLYATENKKSYHRTARDVARLYHRTESEQFLGAAAAANYRERTLA